MGKGVGAWLIFKERVHEEIMKVDGAGLRDRGVNFGSDTIPSICKSTNLKTVSYY